MTGFATGFLLGMLLAGVFAVWLVTKVNTEFEELKKEYERIEEKRNKLERFIQDHKDKGGR